MLGQLAVKVNDGQRERHATRYARGLRFSKSAYGGHKSASVRLVLPRGTFDDLGPADKLYVYDTRTGATIWEGNTQRPTPSQGPFGDAYDITALGGMALAGDETRPLVYVDHGLGDFVKASDSANASAVETGEWVANAAYDRVRTSFPGGQVLAGGGVVSAENALFARIGMTLGGVRVGNYNSGKISSDYACELVTPGGTVVSASMSTSGAGILAFITDTGFPSGTQRFALRLRRTGGSTNVADDTTWTDWVDVSCIGQRMDRHGTPLTGSGGLGSASSVLAHQVVEDLLGRLLTMCDPDLSTVEATTELIDQLAYPDGITAAGVLDDLGLWEGDFLWEMLHTTASGLHVFNYRAWPTAVRYELTTADGYTPTVPDSDLSNRIAVTYTDPSGTRHTEVVTAYVPALDNQVPPRVKDAEAIALPDGVGSQALAQRVGAQVLAALNDPPKSGKAIVRRPIMDLLTGQRVEPHEIEPGYPVRLRESGDVLRLTEMEYVDDDSAAVLDVGQPSLTVDQRAARAARAA